MMIDFRHVVYVRLSHVTKYPDRSLSPLRRRSLYTQCLLREVNRLRKISEASLFLPHLSLQIYRHLIKAH